MQFNLYNTETRQKAPVILHGDRIRLYTCGPTIYDFAHIGNFRTYVVEDLLRRTLKFFGFRVEQAMNITDIDDKTIRGAIQKGVSLQTYTEPFRVAFFEDLKKLSIESAEHYPAATHCVASMIALIETLIEKGFAYKSETGSVYYKIRQFPSYGRLSHLCLSDLQVNARGENEADEYDKESASDFVLWKAYDLTRDGTIFWDSPWGPGRPGWHIECSAMAMQIFGPTLDIHCGGVDNMFPHHENEIAQSEGCTGSLFVRHWMHVEHLLVEHKKMSKSLGHFYTLRDLLARGVSATVVRYLLLSTHYRVQLNFTFEGLEAAKTSLQRLEDLILRLRSLSGEGEGAKGCHLSEEASLKMKAALADDLNISVALAAIFDFVREINTLCDAKQLNRADGAEILLRFERWNEVLGVLPLDSSEKVPEALRQMLQQREEARAKRDFRESDRLRDAIYSQGFWIEDTPQGARLKKL